jgi:hypothetical protein
MMPVLNLPAFKHKITEIEGKSAIYDIIRRKYIILTPEEWVRQHFLNLLIAHLGYSKSLMKVESGLKYDKIDKRSDILVYDRAGKPFLLVECKASDVKIDRQAISQATVYNKSIQAPYFALSNGMNTFCFKVNWETGETVQLKSLPEPF